MRVVVDANVLFSYLMNPDGQSPPPRAVRAGLRREHELLVAEETLSELRRRASSKLDLVRRGMPDGVERLIPILAKTAVIVPPVEGRAQTAVRDPKDRYLVALVEQEQPDYLVVTGDKDLLVLERIGETRVVSPAEFVAILDASAA